LEEALVLEVRRCAIKEDELEQMRKLLEDLVQRQDETRQEEDRLSSIELTLGQQQADTEEKVAKLLLAVAVEKRRAEAAERSGEEPQLGNEAKLKQLQALLETEQVACQRLRSRVGDLEDCLELPRFVGQCSPSLPPCPEEVGTNVDACTGVPGVQAESAAIKELQKQLREEQKMRFQLQAKLLEKDLQLQMPWRRDDSTNSYVSEQEIEGHMLQPADSNSGSSDKDHIILELQHQLADEVALHLDAQGRVAELGRQLRKLEYATETKGISQQQALQNRLIKKDREVCELQDQLVEELTRRQQMQHMMIQKDQTISDLRRQLQHVKPKTRRLTSLVLPQPPVRGEAAGCSSNIQVAAKSRLNARKCNGISFGSPMPLGWRPPLASVPQMPFAIFSPRQAGTLQRASGTIRRGMYVPQQQQGSSIMDGCSITVRAATFCSSPGISSREVSRSFHGC